MGTTLILAEKPSQAMDYGNALSNNPRKKDGYIEIEENNILPNGAKITWALGHLFRLKNPNEYDMKYKRFDMNHLPIFPSKHEYVIDKKYQSRFNQIKMLIDDCSTILLGVDADREGEAIGRDILRFTHSENKEIKRLWINSTEKSEIIEGFKNLRDGSSTYNMFVEAQTREKADWLVGMNLSPLFTLCINQIGYNETISIGRVQSVTVFLIYKREKEIENFVKETFYEVYGHFKHDNGVYKGKANVKTKDKQEALDSLKSKGISPADEGVITNVETKEKTKYAPKLHALSSLQDKANKKWSYPPKKTLEIVQSLYNKKLLSYPRTDSHYITESEYKYLAEYLSKYQNILGVEFEANFENKTYVRNDKVKEHYAIIPTRQTPKSLEDLTQEEQNIYDEVLRTTISMFHQNYLYDETLIVTDVKGLEFKTKGTTDKQYGWKSLFLKEQSTNKKEKKPLPIVNENDNVASQIRIREGETQPPKPYTLGQMITVMMTCGKFVDAPEDAEILNETLGIGTEATRADIIDNIQNKGYVTVKKNRFYMTKKGNVLCESINNTLLSSPEMTAKWEAYLKKIGEGKRKQEDFLAQIHKFIEKMIQEIPEKISNSQNIKQVVHEAAQEKYIAKCPKCENGKIVDKKKLYGCTEYKNGCNFSIWKKIASKNISPTTVKELCEQGKSKKLKGLKKRSGETFSTHLHLNKSFEVKFN